MSDSLQSFLSQIGDVTLEKFTDNKDTDDGDPLEGTNQTAQEVAQVDQEITEKPVGNEAEKIETMDSADDMDLEETIDTQIGVRVIDQHKEPENQNEEEKKVEEMDAVNILESLPLAGKINLKMSNLNH